MKNYGSAILPLSTVVSLAALSLETVYRGASNAPREARYSWVEQHGSGLGPLGHPLRHVVCDLLFIRHRLLSDIGRRTRDEQETPPHICRISLPTPRASQSLPTLRDWVSGGCVAGDMTSL